MSKELDEAREDLRRLIVGTCNTVGCGDCSFKWDGGCRSDYLQDIVFDIEIKEERSKQEKPFSDGVIS